MARKLCTTALLILVAAAPAWAGSSGTAGKTTLEQTIVRGGPDAAFDHYTLGPGEDRFVRTELAAAQPGRQDRRVSLLYFTHISDFQLPDEESPARVEALDPTTDPAPFAAAFRPQEALAPFAADRAVDQVNRFVDASPHVQGDGARARMRSAVVTGDAIDNAQRNEVEWLRTLLQGGTFEPNSGTDGVPGCPGEGPVPVYTGVQDYDDYAETPDFYDPDQPAGIYAAWPQYPGLMDRAQQPFQTAGLRVPSYMVYGNHDRLVQGNQAPSRTFEDIATGCLKTTQSFADPRTAFETITPGYVQQALLTNPSSVFAVPADPRRHFVSSKNFKDLLKAGSQADGMGFGHVDPEEDRASNGAAGYYAFDAAPNVRFLVMDSTVEAGIAGPGAGGNIDDPQFHWIERELEVAKERDQLVITFSHTNSATMDTMLEDEIAGECAGDDGHGHGQNPGCDADPRDSRPIHTGPEMVALFQRYPNVIAWLAGHTHENNLDARRPEDGSAPGFWGVETASISDNPMQTRLVEVMDNRDGTLSIFGTVLDTSAPVAIPPPGPAAGFSRDELAALGRTFSFNDPQGALNGRPGRVNDRNVELVVPDPRRAACRDDAGPNTRLRRRSLRVTRRRVRVAGSSRDQGCVTEGSARPGRVARVDVAVALRVGRRCRFVGPRGRLGRVRRCTRPRFHAARTRYSARRRATLWSLRRGVRLPVGRYRVIARGVDLLGNREALRRPR